MYKIFINEHPLLISSDSNDVFKQRNMRLMDDDEESINKAIEMLENTDRSIRNFGVLIPTLNELETFQRFKSRFSEITAAGGVIYNQDSDVLLIKRQGRWDLPKGKKDEQEKVESAAVREVKEECGIKKLILGDFITKSYHCYNMENVKVLKITHWFNMLIESDTEFKPQGEENITEVKWFKQKDLDIEKLDTYNSIREILNFAFAQNKETSKIK